MIARVAAALVTLGVLWHPVRAGVWQHESPMAAKGPLSVVNAIAIRINPAAHRFTLEMKTQDDGMRGAWTVDAMPDDGIVALNAGQFFAGFPWGWIVRDGVESQSPGTGSVTMAFVVSDGGSVSLLTPDEIPSMRGRATLAFQSYPALLVDGKLPPELLAPGRGVDLEHRDSRLAICTLGDGEMVVALTRFTGLGDAGSTLPWGPTVPEMAAHMRSLGCRRAMLLDGGISSQLAVRNERGKLLRWTNWRAVPLGLVVTPRAVVRR
jgi:exopolysaccharide biosynthesis protein